MGTDPNGSTGTAVDSEETINGLNVIKQADLACDQRLRCRSLKKAKSLV